MEFYWTLSGNNHKDEKWKIFIVKREIKHDNPFKNSPVSSEEEGRNRGAVPIFIGWRGQKRRTKEFAPFFSEDNA